MATIPIRDVLKVRDLYCNQQLSAREISEQLGFPLDAVYYAMRRNRIQRRNNSENSKIQFEKKPLSYKLKEPLSHKDGQLKLAGVMLYWSEGYKTEKSNGIDFANSDIEMQKLFISFLRRICGVDEHRIRISLYSHANVNVPKLIRFWSKNLQVSTKQFTKPYIRKDYRLDKKHKMPYGLVHIRYSDKKLLKQILDWIGECKQQFNT